MGGVITLTPCVPRYGSGAETGAAASGEKAVYAKATTSTSKRMFSVHSDEEDPASDDEEEEGL